MNTIDFLQTGGFPLETNTLDSMQTAYAIFNKYGAMIGEKTIITGCVQTGGTISNGVIYVNGELLEFIGGTLQQTILIREDVTTAVFEDGLTKPVYRKRYAEFGSGVNAINWSEFTRTKTLKELSEETLPTATESIKGIAKLATTAEAISGVNDEKIITPKKLSQAVSDKLTSYVEKLHSGSIHLGDAPNGDDELITINIPNVGTTNYLVLGNFRSISEASWNQNNDIIYIVAARNLTNFKIGVRELSVAVQNVYFDYVLIKL